jgi:predicted O-linked N-acetylglucosamine transferase (SPINDLY family)
VRESGAQPASSTGISRALQHAISLHERNHLAEAVAVCERVLHEAPDHFDALRLLGNLQLGTDQPAAAISTFDRALLLQPESSELLYNRGNALQRIGRFEDAVASYDCALRYRSNFPECLNNRGTALQKLHRYAEARASHEEALKRKPNYPSAFNNLGLALLRSQKPNAAVEAFTRALEHVPDYALAWNNLGTALCAMRKLHEALASVNRALALNGDFPEALLSRALISLHFAHYEDALRDARKSLDLAPDSAAGLSLLAEALVRTGSPDQAVAALARLKALRPDFDYVAGDLLSARLSCCEWSNLNLAMGEIHGGIAAGKRVIRPFQLLSVCGSAAIQLQCSTIFASHTLASPATPLWTGGPYGHAKIRVAYISPDFRDHPVSRLTAQIFEAHDRGAFDVIGMSLAPMDEGPLGRRIRNAFEEYIDASAKNDAEISRMLREREIDIAIDLKGFTDEPRTYLAFRPAPVQVNYLGFPGTLGSRFHDYIIADDFVIPRSQFGNYSEKVVSLPECFQANDGDKRLRAAASERSHHGLSRSSFVFASFNQCQKLNPEIFDIWMRLLAAMPCAVLWILAETSAARRNLVREASLRGIGADRLVFAARVDYAAHVARLELADLSLDTHPFNGGATVSDAIWAGLPVVTCAGSSFAARMAGSLLRAVNLSELVADNLGEYEALARTLADEPNRLAEVRGKLRRSRIDAALFDGTRFCRYLEAAYHAMWQRVEQGDPTDHIHITRPRADRGCRRPAKTS